MSELRWEAHTSPSPDSLKEMIIPGIDTPIKVEITIEEGVPGTAEEKEMLVEEAERMLSTAYVYLGEMLGLEIPISKELSIDIRRRPRHGGQGMLIYISADRLRAATRSDDRYVKTREESLIVHELLHNLTDDEEVPLVGELSYILRQGAEKRLREIEELCDESKMPQVYLNAFGKIATWLGYIDYKELLRSLTPQRVQDVQLLLKREVAILVEAEAA